MTGFLASLFFGVICFASGYVTCWTRDRRHF